MRFNHRTIHNNSQFESEYREKIRHLLMTEPFNRGAAHAMKDDTTAHTHELMHVVETFEVDVHPSAWRETVKPNLPWAEDHFRERISGEPMNPSPSEAWWPFARQGNAEHKKEDQKFSHTYPERFWPKHAGFDVEDWGGHPSPTGAHHGIRFPYGDLNDLIEVLRENPNSRQAYLPIWFPEDLYAARQGERVPCSMGYHFIYNPAVGKLDCVYTMRSCDIVRFYRDDIYMAGRLLQHVAGESSFFPGILVAQIANLHCFPGDRPFLESLLPKFQVRDDDPRKNYNFGAL